MPLRAAGRVPPEPLVEEVEPRDANAGNVNMTQCCAPKGCLEPGMPVIRMDDLHDVVKVICNNEQCDQGRYMHRGCFDDWEETVLTYLRSCGRARSWSEKQRHQNLWTKKGYDLTYKACSCKCDKGHLRKDLDWMPPAAANKTDDAGKKKRKHKKRGSERPTLMISNNNLPANAGAAVAMPKAINMNHNMAPPPQRQRERHDSVRQHPVHLTNFNYDVSPPNERQHQHHHQNNNMHQNNLNQMIGRNRTSSMSSTGSGASAGSSANGGVSPPMFGSEGSSSPDIQSTSIKKLFFGTDNMQAAAAALAARTQQLQIQQQQHKQEPLRPLSTTMTTATLAARERNHSGSIFSRRADYSTFNVLPRTKINSYHIKMEDDSTSDETRNFILAALSSSGKNRMQCILCRSALPIFDRFPLIDGTFFLSPRQHGPSAVPVKYDHRAQYLNSVCMGCLEGWSLSIRCRGCRTKWNGTAWILGTMYTYDIFAATPCCSSRLKCNQCGAHVIRPERPLEYFSDYSHALPCASCKHVDHHFVKPLGMMFAADNVAAGLTAAGR